MAGDSSPREPDLVTINAFQFTFEDVLLGNAEDLKTLESEAAIYAEFADYNEDGKFLGTFTRYRIQFTPPEIVEYVQAHIAEQEYLKALRLTDDFTAAVLAVSDPRFRQRVAAYNQYGKSRLSGGGTIDNRGCLASFLGPDLEALVCGHRRDRYELAPEQGGSSTKNGLVTHALKSVAVSARKLGDRGHGRENVSVTSEYDVQDLAETALRAVYPDVEREDWTTKSAGSAKRIDLVIPSAATVIECKFARDATHARKLADELRIDFECYHEHNACRELFVYIYDPNHHIHDPESFADALSGPRQKRNHMFDVYVIIN